MKHVKKKTKKNRTMLGKFPLPSVKFHLEIDHEGIIYKQPESYGISSCNDEKRRNIERVCLKIE